MDETRAMTREEAAAGLRALADSLAKHNSVEFARDGGRVTVFVPDEVRSRSRSSWARTTRSRSSSPGEEIRPLNVLIGA